MELSHDMQGRLYSDEIMMREKDCMKALKEVAGINEIRDARKLESELKTN